LQSRTPYGALSFLRTTLTLIQPSCPGLVNIFRRKSIFSAAGVQAKPAHSMARTNTRRNIGRSSLPVLVLRSEG